MNLHEQNSVCWPPVSPLWEWLGHHDCESVQRACKVDNVYFCGFREWQV